MEMRGLRKEQVCRGVGSAYRRETDTQGGRNVQQGPYSVLETCCQL